MSTLTRIALDFAEFYSEPLRHLCDALNDDRTFERALAVIGVAGLVVIGVTL
ncbi:hypothetical protein [Aquabacterium sp.]|uniref:hypothetical protein n=1 Tax=Aquabacterium sp. TaxID=1872578 RepID=UPI003D08F234